MYMKNYDNKIFPGYDMFLERNKLGGLEKQKWQKSYHFILRGKESLSEKLTINDSHKS